MPKPSAGSRASARPVRGQLAIMRHGYGAGQFDLYAATKDTKMATRVHG
jgi:hypothetical protein